MGTKEEVIITKANVDIDIENLMSKLKKYKSDTNLNFFNIFEFFSYQEIDKIFKEDKEIRKLFEKAMQSQENLINTMQDFMKEE